MTLHAVHDGTDDPRTRSEHRVLIVLLAILLMLGFTRPAEGQPPLAVDSRAHRETRELLPALFRKYETRRFVILSDADPRWVRQQGTRLERVHHQFMRFARRMNIKTKPLRHKLVCVLFDDQDAYRRFADTNDRAGAEWIAGYYAPHADRVVFYNVLGDQSILEAYDTIDEMQREIRDLESEIHRARRGGHRQPAALLRDNLDRYKAHVERERDRIEQFASSLDVATTVHEVLHQLLFHTRVQTPRVEYPVWISEGLATSFETADINRTFGPDCEFGQRREAFDELLRAGKLIDLEKLIPITDVPDDDETVVRQIYHQSYAFVTWICRFQRKELQRYFTLMKREPTGTPTADRHLEIFQTAFGDIDRIEQRWLRHERDRLAMHGDPSVAAATQ